jgi:hypothetical protein
MMQHRILFCVTIFLCLFTLGCESTSENAADVTTTSTTDASTSATPDVPVSCIPDEERPCTCANGDSGAQHCNDDGNGWLQCYCIQHPTLSDAGAMDGGL